jgi:hypothetical protein
MALSLERGASHGLPHHPLPAYVESATGVVVIDIFERWQQPQEH